MSGTNPFRRNNVTGPSPSDSKPPIVHAPAAYHAKAHPQSINTDVTRLNKVKATKTVRIISPETSRSDHRDFDSHNSFSKPHTGSPPPESVSSAGSDEDSREDPFEIGVRSDEVAGDTGIHQDLVQRAQDAWSDTGAISTLPLNSSPKGSSSSSPDQGVSNSRGLDLGSRSGRASLPKQYDVEDFKRLLLTGEKTLTATGTPRAPVVSFGQPTARDDHSSIDIPSNTQLSTAVADPDSQYSLTPSIDKAALAGIGKSATVIAPEPAISRSKPPEPKHRHGKLIAADIPQTVSFEDSALTNNELLEHSKATPFAVMHSSYDTMTNHEMNDNEKAKITKRVPPVPPLSRRHSGRRPTSFGSNPDRSQSIPEETAPERSSEFPSDAPKSSVAPPPPPPRRSGVTRGNSTSSVPSIASAATGSDFSSIEEAHRSTSKALPPPPLSRSPSIVATNSSHYSTPSSTTSSAPPVPPPRRRGSSQSSYTPSRLSGDYRAMTGRLRSDSGASSISQLQMTNLDTGQSDKKDIMADLTALQRDVDEFRGKMRA